MKLGDQARSELLNAAESLNVYLEGNILKIIDTEDDNEFKNYIDKAIERDKETRRKRLEITKSIQSQNVELLQAEQKNIELMSELREALQKAEDAKNNAERDLDIIQKKSQFELIGIIVKTSLSIVVGVGIITTILYIVALITKQDTALLGNTWSSMFGILLTNCFSIIGTIMGVKYATENQPGSPKS